MRKISIITIVYNCVNEIEKTINSVISQKNEEVEYIVVDGNSTDGTKELINKFNNKIDVFISEKDSGIYNAMNKGIRCATGDYIAFLNAGDWYEPNTINIILDSIQNKADIDVFYGLVKLWENKVYIGISGNTINSFPSKMINHPTCFIKSKIYKNNLFDESYKSAADYDFLSKIYKTASFFFIEYPLCNFELGGISSGLIGGVETNEIQKKYGFITRKQYIKNKLKFFIKGFIN